MKPSASQIRQAFLNHHLPARTLDARIKDILTHVQASKHPCPCLRLMQLQHRNYSIEASRKAAS